MPVFFDIETQNTFQEVGGRFPQRLSISIAVTYDTTDQAFHRYTEAEAAQLAFDLSRADLVVGYNLYGFDYPVLQRYTTDLVLAQLPTVDMMVEIQKRLGFRLKLDSIATATLKVGKSADGLQAVRWWKEQNIEALFSYCEQDVEVTRRIYEFGKQHRYVEYYDRRFRIQKVPVAW
jgi:DEAD/DEAH box helicase domain-containing protein